MFYGDIVILENIDNKKEWWFTRKMGVPRYVNPNY